MVQIENRVSATLSTGPRLTQMTKDSEACNVGTIQFEAYSLHKNGVCLGIICYRDNCHLDWRNYWLSQTYSLKAFEMGESSVELTAQMSFVSQQTLKTLYLFIGATPFRAPLARPTCGRLHGKTGGKQRTE